MTIKEWLAANTAGLHAAGIGSARLDALVLLEDALQTDRAYVLAHDDRELTAQTVSQLNARIKRRKTHEPLAYIRGKVEFYGREFSVNPLVLVPRPESETIIELLLTLPLPASITIADIGTGSGALAVSAKCELPAARVIGIDIDPACLEVAEANAKRHAADISWFAGGLAEPLLRSPADTTVLLCNLPYVPDDYPINRAAGHEPALALYSGYDGLEHYRTLFGQVQSAPSKPLHIITESLPRQHKALSVIAADAGYRMERSDNYIQLFSQ